MRVKCKILFSALFDSLLQSFQRMNHFEIISRLPSNYFVQICIGNQTKIKQPSYVSI